MLFRSLIRIVKKRGIQVLVSTKRKDYALAGLVSRMCGVKNVVRLGIVRRVEDRWINRIVYGQWADGFVVNAQRIKDALQESAFLLPKPIRVVYNGVDAAGIVKKAETETETIPLPRFRFSVVSVGELSGRKGMDALMRGFAEFRSRLSHGSGAGLVLVGDGASRSGLETLARELGIADTVAFPGFLSNPHPIVKRSDAFVLASGNEGVSNAMLEAMALGVPVVTTRAGGAAEVIRDGENGLLLADAKPGSIAGAIERLYHDAARRKRIAAAGRRTVLEQYGPERMADELMEFFKGLVHARSSS